MNSIRAMLVTGLAAIAALFLVQAGLLSWGQRTIERDVVATAQKNTIASSQLSELAVVAQQVRRYEKEYFVYVTNQERRENYVKEWTGASDKMAKLVQTMRANADGAFTADDIGKISTWASAAEFYSSEMKKIFDVVNGRQNQIGAVTPAPSASASSTAKPATAAIVANPSMYSPVEVNGMITAGKDRLSGVLIKGVSDMSAAKTKATLALPGVTKAGFEKLWAGVMATVLLGFVIAGFLALKMPAAITGPIEKLSAAVERMSKGELDKPIDVAAPREFGVLTTAVERMRVAQNVLVQRMRARVS
jgi:methyl-accepting chemotaxis protein